MFDLLWNLSLRKFTLALLMALAVMAILGGCGVRQLAKGELEPPKVTLKGLRLSQPSPQGVPLSVSLLLDNPNSQSLNLLGYDFELWLAGKSVAQGASQKAVTLPPLGQAVVEVPILLKLPSLVQILPALLLAQEQKLPYQIAGGCRLASLLGGLRVPFKFQGELTPKEGLENLRAYLR